MSIKVWHIDDRAIADLHGPSNMPKAFLDVKTGFRNDGSQAAAFAELFSQGHCKLVAEVGSSDPEQAWHLTNHVDRQWQDNPGVRAVPGPHRSSCVGDALEMPDGSWLLCASFGWTPIADPRPPRAPSSPSKPPKP